MAEMTADQRDAKGKFLPGSGGRPAGSRNKLQADFVNALQEDFSEHGIGVIRIVRGEKPVEYLKIVASILPKELLLPDNVLDEMTDAELIEAIATIRRLKGVEATEDKAEDPEERRH
jgi:hypothetical protein